MHVDATNLPKALKQRGDCDNEWRDISESFISACKELGIGELVHDDHFSLYEAMSAIELMDPKMDAGMQNARVKTFEEYVETGAVVLSDIPASIVLSAIDGLLASYVTWIEGHSLAQTVFLSLYMHKPQLIEDVPLRAFCFGLLRLINFTRDVIISAAVSEEEDFQAMTFDFDLASATSDHRVMGTLKEAEEHAERQAKKSSQEVAQIHAAIGHRIRFLRLLFASMKKLTFKEQRGIVGTFTGPSKLSTQLLDECQKMLMSCEHALARVSESVNLSLKFVEDPESIETYPSFISGVTRHLLPPTFPRQTRLLSVKEAVQYSFGLLSRLRSAAALPLQSGSFDTILDHFRIFSGKRSCVLSRSVLHLAYFPEGDSEHLLCHIVESLKQFCTPPSFVGKSSTDLSSWFRDHPCANLMYDSVIVLTSAIQICGNNRARQKEKLGIFLEDMAQLQDVMTNSRPQASGPLSDDETWIMSYIVYHGLQAMEQYLLIGFELQLYASYEFVYIYWYLAGVIYKWLLNFIQRAEAHVRDIEAKSEASASKSSSSSKAKRMKNRKRAKQHRYELMHYGIMEKTSDAFFKGMVGLEIAGRVEQPELANDPGIRYDRRIRPFVHLITPPFYDYAHFEELSGYRSALAMLPAEHLYKEAASAFEEVKAILDSLSVVDDNNEFLGLMKVIKNNAILFRLLSNGHKKDTDWKPEFDFSHHRYFPLLRAK